MDDNLKRYFEITADKRFIVKQGKYVEVRMPNYYFTTNVSEIIGDTISTFGFLDLYVWDTVSDENKDSDSVKIHLRLPTLISTKPTRIIGDSKNDMTILEYFGGDALIVNTVVAKTHKVVVKYILLMLNGKIPDDIPYDQIISYLEKCCELNNINMGVNSIFLDLMAMMVSRDPQNPSRQFREALRDNPKLSMLMRKLVNVDAIPSLTSQFSAITGSNPKFAMTSSIGAVRSGDMKLEESDIEKAIQ